MSRYMLVDKREGSNMELETMLGDTAIRDVLVDRHQTELEKSKVTLELMRHRAKKELRENNQWFGWFLMMAIPAICSFAWLST